MSISDDQRKTIIARLQGAEVLQVSTGDVLRSVAKELGMSDADIMQLVSGGDEDAGVAAAVGPSVGQTNKLSQVDPWFSTGGASDQMAFQMRKLALTDPENYEKARNAELKKIKGAVDNQFVTTLNAYKSAGYDIQTAESEALKAAKQSKDVLFKAMNLKFGDNDGIFLKGADHKVGAYKVPHGKR
jgi:hypothetical protein